jgi:serine O-acetyltransferase
MYVYTQIAIWWLDPPNTSNIIINQKRGLNNMDKIIEHNVNDIVDTILNDYTHDRSIDKMKLFTQPDRFVIIKIIDNLMKIMYPGYFRDTSHKIYIMENSTRVLIEDTLFRLNKQIELALKYSPDYENAMWRHSV